MCVSCACKCKCESFDDLYEASNNCLQQRHKIIHPTTKLNISGKYSGAVDYINACRMFVLKHFIEARYFLEQAMLKSCARENKLNEFIRENSKVLLGIIKEKQDISENQIPVILTLTEILARSENYTYKNQISNKYNNIKILTEKQSKRKLNDKKIKRLPKNLKVPYNKSIKIFNKTKKLVILKKTNTETKRPIKITFTKTKTVTPLLTFSQVAKIKSHNRNNMLTNFKNKIILENKNVDENSINLAIKISHRYNGNNKLLLLGGTQKRKRKRVDYAKLNISGFDIPSPSNIQNEESHSVSRRTGKIQSESMSKPKIDNYKKLYCTKNQKQYSLSQEFEFLKKTCDRNEYLAEPQTKNENLHEQKLTKKMKIVSTCSSHEQKDSSFTKENTNQKIPNEMSCKEIKQAIFIEDCDWEPQKRNNSHKKLRKKGYKTKQH